MGLAHAALIELHGISAMERGGRPSAVRSICCLFPVALFRRIAEGRCLAEQVLFGSTRVRATGEVKGAFQAPAAEITPSARSPCQQEQDLRPPA